MAGYGKFEIWIDNPTSSNVMPYSSLLSDSQKRVGFQAGQAASAIRVNTMLRQSSLITVGLLQSLNLDTNADLSAQSSLTDLTAALANTNLFKLNNALVFNQDSTKILQSVSIDPSQNIYLGSLAAKYAGIYAEDVIADDIRADTITAETFKSTNIELNGYEVQNLKLYAHYIQIGKRSPDFNSSDKQVCVLCTVINDQAVLYSDEDTKLDKWHKLISSIRSVGESADRMLQATGWVMNNDGSLSPIFAVYSAVANRLTCVFYDSDPLKVENTTTIIDADVTQTFYFHVTSIRLI